MTDFSLLPRWNKTYAGANGSNFDFPQPNHFYLSRPGTHSDVFKKLTTTRRSILDTIHGAFLIPVKKNGAASDRQNLK
ncbi:MAG: hypothetical protein J6B53_02855 [Clostridia bacterium]|nr:hypothetical protein [Clostridia bacterium]